MLIQLAFQGGEGNMRNAPFAAAVCLAVLSVFSSGAWGAEAPRTSEGFTTPKTLALDLGPEIQGMAGRQLRMRLLRIAPGGRIAIHSHQNRPSIVYFLQGSDTIVQADGSSRTFHPGDMSVAGKNTIHWHRNDGRDDVVLIAVDVFEAK